MQKIQSTPNAASRAAVIERLREAGILAILLLGAVVFSLTVPSFFSVDNAITGIGLSAAINTIVAIGLTYVIMTGGIDLSVGSTAALSAVIGADLMQRGLPPLLAVVVALGVGALAGLVNGLLITRVQLAPFIVTLGTMTFYRGLALSYTNGQPILSLPDGFKNALGGDVFGLPIPLIAALLLVGAFTLILRYTKTGQYILAIGGNAEAVRLSGINVGRFITLTYVISGVLAAFAALVLIAQLGAAEPILGSGWELSAIAASVVGGTSLAGGKGNVVGALLGALLLSMLQNVLTLLGVQAFYQLLATGLIIIGAMVIDRYTRGP
ncbi:ABC transporter permease [Deinococcus sp. KSM4-11]|uniref:ABC transporter permease n=1 Tax=Deinococcus sp. KSM4-11 TaxID=2568654 RepID=UPI0010A53247|nr:ABC transporter permease [Deinococcus sp. KSM4-11]THF85582.1 ABC transporter permease [Deinococcus sp. KSM4-11]